MQFQSCISSFLNMILTFVGSSFTEYNKQYKNTGVQFHEFLQWELILSLSRRLCHILAMVNNVNLPIASFLFLLHVYWLALVITYLGFIMVCTHIRIHSWSPFSLFLHNHIMLKAFKSCDLKHWKFSSCKGQFLQCKQITPWIAQCGQSELALTKAPVGHSIHMMGLCFFIQPQSANFFWVFGAIFLSTLTFILCSHLVTLLT
jgi:hypothetical protein